MRFGPRRPSLKGRIAARTSWKRYVKHSLDFKAPRGMGWMSNPRKAAYNRVYNKTTFDLFKKRGRRGATTPGSPIIGIVVMVAYILYLLGVFS